MRIDFPTYVMHYTPNTERRNFLQKLFEIENFTNVNWITDYDRESIIESNLSENFKITQEECDRRNNHLKQIYSHPEERSLSLKHLDALKKFVNSDYEFALFLEDDSILEQNFIEKFFFYFDKKPNDFELGYVNHGYPHDRIDDPDKQYWFRKYWPNAVKFSDAMVFTKSTAKTILNCILQYKICFPIDHEYSYWIRENNIKVYWLEPPICAQGSQCGLFRSFQLKYGSNHYDPNLLTLRNDWEKFR